MNENRQRKFKKAAGLLLICFIAGTGMCFVGCQKNIPVSENIKIALAGPMSRMAGEFENGVNLALEEIKEKEYGQGREVTAEYFDDRRDLTTGIRIAQEIAEKKEQYTAVIGHWNASINLPAADIYNKAGVLAISPMVSTPELTIPTKNYIFRNIPTDADEAKKIAQYAKDKGYKRIAICYTNSDYGKGLANQFEYACKELSIAIVDSHENFINQAEFDRQYEKWEALQIDAVFIADSLPYAEGAIKEIREKSKTLPILSAAGFSFDDVIAILGSESENITYVSLYYPQDKNPTLQDFNARYKAAYGKEPASYLAAKGYESIYLVVDAVLAVNTTDSKAVAEYLHNMEPWQGVLGAYNFKENGDTNDMKLFTVEVKNGTYRYQ